MAAKGMKKTSKVSYEIEAELVSLSRIYQLVRFSFPEMSKDARNRTLGRFIDETDAIGLVEWWERGSIIKKPRLRFYAIVIRKKTKSASTSNLIVGASVCSRIN